MTSHFDGQSHVIPTDHDHPLQPMASAQAAKALFAAWGSRLALTAQADGQQRLCTSERKQAAKASPEVGAPNWLATLAPSLPVAMVARLPTVTRTATPSRLLLVMVLSPTLGAYHHGMPKVEHDAFTVVLVQLGNARPVRIVSHFVKVDRHSVQHRLDSVTVGGKP